MMVTSITMQIEISLQQQNLCFGFCRSRSGKIVSAMDMNTKLNVFSWANNSVDEASHFIFCENFKPFHNSFHHGGGQLILSSEYYHC